MLGNTYDFCPRTQLSTILNEPLNKDVSSNEILFQLIQATTTDHWNLGPLAYATLSELGGLVSNFLNNHLIQLNFSGFLADVDNFLSNCLSIYCTSMKDRLECVFLINFPNLYDYLDIDG